MEELKRVIVVILVTIAVCFLFDSFFAERPRKQQYLETREPIKVLVLVIRRD